MDVTAQDDLKEFCSKLDVTAEGDLKELRSKSDVTTYDDLKELSSKLDVTAQDDLKELSSKLDVTIRDDLKERNFYLWVLSGRWPLTFASAVPRPPPPLFSLGVGGWGGYAVFISQQVTSRYTYPLTHIVCVIACARAACVCA